jgi:hypothetical protein
MNGRFLLPLLLSLLASLVAAQLYAQCTAPAQPAFTFAPPGDVGAGQTYTLAWFGTTGDVDDYYVIERATSSSFTPILDSQEVSTPSASFVVDAEGRYYHRVKAIPACNPSMQSGYSSTASVNVVAGSASVVFSVQPKPVITNLGDSLANAKTTFVLENVTRRPVTVLVTERALGSNPNFFRVVDPSGGNLINLTLEPATPKTLELRFDGFSTPGDQRQSYQGVIVILSSELAVIPYAFVNLKIGGTGSATPYFAVGATPVEYVAFPGFAGVDDLARPALKVDIVNPGASAQEVGAEIGPEVWLEPESGWNANPIPAGDRLSVPLFTVRERALSGSPLPRYTYFTVHTRSGETARLLVQDNDTSSVDSSRTKLDKEVRSYVIPGVLGEDLGGHRRRHTILTLANVGPADVMTELFFTPEGVDGLTSSNVKRSVVVVPSHDVVRLTDPLLQVFGHSGSSRGQVEVRADSSRIGFLNLAARVFTPDSGGVGGVGWRLPVFARGEGARDVTPHSIPGVTIAAGETGELVLAETTGVDGADVLVALVSTNGSTLGSRSVRVRRYGQARVSSILSLGAGSQIVGARLVLSVTEGKGSIAGTLLVRDDAGRGWTLVSQPTAGPVTSRAALSPRQAVDWPHELYVRGVRPDKVASPEASVQYLVPNVVNGSFGAVPGTFRTTVGVSSPSGTSSTLTMTLVDSSGSQLGKKAVTLGAGQSVEYANVVTDLFGLSGQVLGTLLVDSSNLGALLYARQTTSSGTTSPSLAVPTGSVSLTSASSGEKRPIYIDGLAQSVSSLRGANWALVMTEVRNAGAIVELRLYEAGNRVVPIAAKSFAIPALGEVRLGSLFADMNLSSTLRAKDRINLMVVVVPKSGNGLVSALVQSLDNTTNNLTTWQPTPSGGVPATGVALAAPIPDEPEPEEPPRRRPVRR